MSDPLRRDAAPPGDALPDRQVKVEELLVLGLDHYFAGEYEQAIHIWTRVLFVDRGHARARAYIERARGALAERQRASEELLHVGEEAFRTGDVDAARRLLTSAAEGAGPREEALALLGRLDRLEPVGSDADVVTPAPPHRRARPGHRPRRGRIVGPSRPASLLLIPLLAGLVAAVTYVGFTWDTLGRFPLFGSGRPPIQAASPPPETPVPVPSVSELALARGRLLLERGHLHESLQALDRVRPGDPLRPAADELRTTIQRALLSGTEPRLMLDTAGAVDPLTGAP